MVVATSHTGRGKAAMDRIYIAIPEMQDEERALLETRTAEAQRSGRMSLWVIAGTVFCAVVLVALAGTVIHRDIAARKRAEQEREAGIKQLREALATVKTLSGLLPICAWCKNIRDDQGYWKELEEYIGDHTGAVLNACKNSRPKSTLKHPAQTHPSCSCSRENLEASVGAGVLTP
jgi:hypothetical protein